MSHGNIFEIQADLCQTMGNPVQMEIVSLLWSGTSNVNEIACVGAQHQATVSRNLTILRNAGIVVTERDSNNIIDQVADPKFRDGCDVMREV